LGKWCYNTFGVILLSSGFVYTHKRESPDNVGAFFFEKGNVFYDKVDVLIRRCINLIIENYKKMEF
jgi:hypothetical protein